MDEGAATNEELEGAKALAKWLGYKWDGLQEGRIVDRGYPVWAINAAGSYQMQGDKGDLVDAVRAIAASAFAEIEALRAENAALRQDQRILNALRMGGVENWEWYEDAIDILGEDKP